MTITEITLTTEEAFGASCIAAERNERAKQQHERSLASANHIASDAHRAADRAAQDAHRESERVAFEAHTGDDRFVPTEYVPGDPFVADETPYSPRGPEEMTQDAVREMLTQCAENAHQKEIADIGRLVMEMEHVARRDAIDALTDSQD